MPDLVNTVCPNCGSSGDSIVSISGQWSLLRRDPVTGTTRTTGNIEVLPVIAYACLHCHNVRFFADPNAIPDLGIVDRP